MPVLMLVPDTARRRPTDEIRWRRTGRLPAPMVIDGLRVAPVTRALADHALDLRSLDAVRGTTFEALNRRLTSADELWAEYLAGPRNRSAFLRRTIFDIQAGARSVPEAMAADFLHLHRVDGFVQNQKIIVAGLVIYPDFRWPDLQAILEIDSREHHYDDEGNWQDTMRRDQFLQSAGYRVLHVSPRQVASSASFVERVRRWLEVVRKQRSTAARA